MPKSVTPAATVPSVYYKHAPQSLVVRVDSLLAHRMVRVIEGLRDQLREQLLRDDEPFRDPDTAAWRAVGLASQLLDELNYKPRHTPD